MMNFLAAALSGGLVFKVICLAEVREESLGIRSHQTACRRGHWRIFALELESVAFTYDTPT